MIIVGEMLGNVVDFQYLYIHKEQKKQPLMEPFEIRAYGRTELAQCYFPSLTPQSAYRKLESWIDYHPTLRDRLRATSTNPHSRVYMPVQVRLIVEAIGEP